MEYQNGINNNNINQNPESKESLKENSIQINHNLNQNTMNARYGEPIDQNIFHKKKKDYNTFTINPEVEEIPTFTFENDRNLKSYKGRINNKYSLIEQYSKNYLEYMKKFENRRKTPFSSPFLVYQEKTKGNNNIFNSYDNSLQENPNKTIDVNSYSNKIRENNFKNYYNNQNQNNNSNDELDLNHNFEMQNNEIRNINSPKFENSLNFSTRSGEITNPNYFFQRNNEDYYKYRLEQKKYLDYNYQIIKNRLNKRNKREIDINPYNPINERPFETGKSDLVHNPILNPINNYSYNKYLEKEVNFGNKCRKGDYSNTNILSNRNNFSTLQNAGNQLLIK